MNYRKMSEADARLIEQWRYPGEYAIYDEPRFSEIPACQREHFISFFEQDQLIGFVNLLEEETAGFSASVFIRRLVPAASVRRSPGKRSRLPNSAGRTSLCIWKSGRGISGLWLVMKGQAL